MTDPSPACTHLRSDLLQCGRLHRDQTDAQQCPAIQRTRLPYRAVFLSKPESLLHEDPELAQPIEWAPGVPAVWIPQDDTIVDARRRNEIAEVKRQGNIRRDAIKTMRTEEKQFLDYERLQNSPHGAHFKQPHNEPHNFTVFLVDPKTAHSKLFIVKAVRPAHLWHRMDAAFFFPARDAYDHFLVQGADPRSMTSWMAPGMMPCKYSGEMTDKRRGVRHPFVLLGNQHCFSWRELEAGNKERHFFRVSPEYYLRIGHNDIVEMHIVLDRHTDPITLSKPIACCGSRFELGAWLSDKRRRKHMPPYFHLSEEFTDVRIRDVIDSCQHADPDATGGIHTMYSFRRKTENHAWLGFYKAPHAPLYLQQTDGGLGKRLKKLQDQRENMTPPRPDPDYEFATSISFEYFAQKMTQHYALFTLGGGKKMKGDGQDLSRGEFQQECDTFYEDIQWLNAHSENWEGSFHHIRFSKFASRCRLVAHMYKGRLMLCDRPIGNMVFDDCKNGFYISRG